MPKTDSFQTKNQTVDGCNPTARASYYMVRSGYASEAVTWGQAIVALLERAGRAFAAGRDVEATLLRDLAKEWEPRERAARKKQADYEAEWFPADD